LPFLPDFSPPPFFPTGKKHIGVCRICLPQRGIIAPWGGMPPLVPVGFVGVDGGIRGASPAEVEMCEMCEDKGRSMGGSGHLARCVKWRAVMERRL
jgi:hypothetical protein